MGLRIGEIAIMLLAIWMQRRLNAARAPLSRRSRWLSALSYTVFGAGIILSFRTVTYALPQDFIWARAVTLVWAIFFLFGAAVYLPLRRAATFHPSRRRFLQTTSAALCAAPVAATGFGILVRDEFKLREIDLPINALPADLRGLKILQISDIHLSPFLDEKALARVIDMANETRPAIAVVTGDLITGPYDPLDACIRQIARLKSDSGIWGCLGNHEMYSNAEDYATEGCRRAGVEMLRDQSRLLRFGAAAVNLVGVDYQPKREPYLTATPNLISRDPKHLNLLLSHNPDVFPVAAEQGFHATLSGHTHGGQVSVEILRQHVNVARFFTPYTYGVYRNGRSSIYVTRGIGTVGIPARIGAPPEIALLRLCDS